MPTTDIMHSIKFESFENALSSTLRVEVYVLLHQVDLSLNQFLLNKSSDKIHGNFD